MNLEELVETYGEVRIFKVEYTEVVRSIEKNQLVETIVPAKHYGLYIRNLNTFTGVTVQEAFDKVPE